MAKIFLFCVIFFYTISGWSVDYHRTVKWFEHLPSADLKDNTESGFEGSLIIDNTGLPYWFESFDLSATGADVSIANAVYEPILHPSEKLINYQKSELRDHFRYWGFCREIHSSSDHLPICKKKRPD